jgi:hypothetical protein
MGTRHEALVALDAIGEEGAADVLRAVANAAREGDMRAAEILLGRLGPEHKGRPVSFALPAMASAADIVAALASVVQAVGAGDLSPEEAQTVAGRRL